MNLLREGKIKLYTKLLIGMALDYAATKTAASGDAANLQILKKKWCSIRALCLVILSMKYNDRIKCYKTHKNDLLYKYPFLGQYWGSSIEWRKGTKKMQQTE